MECLSCLHLFLSVEKHGFKALCERSALEMGTFKSLLGHCLELTTFWTRQIQECKHKFSTVVGKQLCVGDYVETQFVFSMILALIPRVPSSLPGTETLDTMVWYSDGFMTVVGVGGLSSGWLPQWLLDGFGRHTTSWSGFEALMEPRNPLPKLQWHWLCQ